jgi:hypothetical protein
MLYNTPEIPWKSACHVSVQLVSPRPNQSKDGSLSGAQFSTEGRRRYCRVLERNLTNLALVDYVR